MVKSKTDAEITANNRAYFGEPVYEYTLIQAQEDGYLAACEIVKLRPSVDKKTFTREQVLANSPIDARTGKYVKAEDLKAQYVAKDFDDEILMPERIAAMCADLFQRLCEHGGPEQKVSGQTTAFWTYSKFAWVSMAMAVWMLCQ